MEKIRRRKTQEETCTKRREKKTTESNEAWRCDVTNESNLLVQLKLLTKIHMFLYYFAFIYKVRGIIVIMRLFAFEIEV